MGVLRSNKLFTLGSIKDLATGASVGNRPSLESFNQNCDIACEDLEPLHCQCGVQKVVRRGFGFELISTNKTYSVDYTFLCLGIGDTPNNTQHIFHDLFQTPNLEQTIAVVGGGLSAAHIIERCYREGSRDILWVRRRPSPSSPYDAHPRWASLTTVREFQRQSLADRQKTLNETRFDGSIPADLLKNLDSLIDLGFVHPVSTLPGDILPSQTVYATGVSSEPLPLLRQLAEDHYLPIDNQFRPLIQPNLEWTSGLFVLGRYGELMLGPLGRNIAGAGLACKLLPPVDLS